MPVAFGATVDGVRALLPHRTIGPTSKPNEAQVITFLEGGSGWVSGRLGAANVDPAELGDARTDWAKALVELYAGSFAEDAAFPERAAPGDTTYGGVLWERFLKGLDELLEAFGEPTEPGVAAGEEPVGPPGPVLTNFPEPVLITGSLVPPFLRPGTSSPSSSRTV